MLSLRKAINNGRLDDFIDQAEAAGIGPIRAADFDVAVSRIIKTEQSDDQTSHSLPADGLPER